jgi:hypothetical protein
MSDPSEVLERVFPLEECDEAVGERFRVTGMLPRRYTYEMVL